MSDQSLRAHLVILLEGEGAHADLRSTLSAYPSAIAGAKVAGVPHTPWRLMEHLRIAQWDILEFSRNPNHVSPAFPDGYWPDADAPSDSSAWERSVEGFLADLAAMQQLVSDSATDLFAPIPWGDGQTILREALVLADHNSYHLGQLILIEKALGRR
ncbi:MAG TPA: DinB family protein [Gemmatimonadales bacterium]|nr:DinB family protein [Gemmatimonadales bacterium]